MKATEQFFHVVLFTMLYKVFLTFRSVDETNQMMATEQYFHVVLFIILYKVVLALKSAYKNLSVWIFILNVIKQSTTIHLLAQNSSTSPAASLVAPSYQTRISLHVAIKVHLCCFNLSCTRCIYIHLYNPCKSIYKLKPAIQTQAV